jgi:hypothetical protein
MNQSVMVFSSISARNTAIPSPIEGMLVYVSANDNFFAYNGTAWVVAFDIGGWDSWAPVLSNGFANGNGVWSNALYTQVGKTVHFKASFTSGTTSSYGTGMRISLPLTGVTSETVLVSGYVERSTIRYPIVALDMTSTYITLMTQNASGAHVTNVAMTATVPHTWATGDKINVVGTYEAA